VLDVLERAGQSRLPRFNEAAAERLREAATLLAHQGNNPYRVAAYRRAADAVAALTAGLRELLDTGGIKALEEIRGLGSRIAGALRNWRGPGDGPIRSGCAAQANRMTFSVPSQASGRSWPSACTKRFTSTRLSNWRRLCTNTTRAP
jgi:helix-hairpin-helix protein